MNKKKPTPNGAQEILNQLNERKKGASKIREMLSNQMKDEEQENDPAGFKEYIQSLNEERMQRNDDMVSPIAADVTNSYSLMRYITSKINSVDIIEMKLALAKAALHIIMERLDDRTARKIAVLFQELDDTSEFE